MDPVRVWVRTTRQDLSVLGVDVDELRRMRDALFFEGEETNHRLTRFWALLLLAAVIATAGIVADSTATVIGAMIVAPLMTPILGVVLAIGRRGAVNKLGVPGEEGNEKVLYGLADPDKHKGERVLVVGGGDSAVEAAVALAQAVREVLR